MVKKSDAHFLMGLKGVTAFDGYTLFIENAQVYLHFGFHNQYEKEEHFEQFVKKLKAINEQY